MNYWIIENGVTTGPLTARQLAMRHISEQTPVWRAGLPDWTYASQLPEWADILSAIDADTTDRRCGEPVVVTEKADKIPGDSHDSESGTPAPTYLGWSILATLLCCTVIGIVALVYALRVRDENRRGFFDEAHHDSRIVELWLIASVTLGIVSLPFNLVMAML